MRISAAIGVLFTAGAMVAQQKTVTVVDSVTRRPIENVSVRTTFSQSGHATNGGGKAVITFGENKEAYVFYKLGYHRKLVRVEQLRHTDTVFLSQRFFALPEVSIEREAFAPVIKNNRDMLRRFNSAEMRCCCCRVKKKSCI